MSSFPSWNLLYEKFILQKYYIDKVEFPWRAQLQGCCYPYNTPYASHTLSPADNSN